MSQKKHPENPPTQYMIRWISEEFAMSRQDLARMFETSPATIRAWMDEGTSKDFYLQKLRRSFYFLNNLKDPHPGEKQCTDCRRWKPFSDFSKDAPRCHSCERGGKDAGEQRREKGPSRKKSKTAARAGTGY